MKEISPKFMIDSFTCPHCEIASHQRWFHLCGEIRVPENNYPNSLYLDLFTDERHHYDIIEEADIDPYIVARCDHCFDISLWYVNKKIESGKVEWIGKFVYPDKSTAPQPNPDLNQKIRRIYNEARNILNKSPRAACALLRLALEELCKNLGATDNNLPDGQKRLRDRIKYLAGEKGLDNKIKEAFENVRLAGNEALHTGEINLSDKKENANLLFEMINIIADDLITKENKIKKLRKVTTKAKDKK